MIGTTLQLGITVPRCCGGCVRDFSCTAEDVSSVMCSGTSGSEINKYSLKTPTCEGKEVHVSISFGLALVGYSFCVSELFLN